MLKLLRIWRNSLTFTCPVPRGSILTKLRLNSDHFSNNYNCNELVKFKMNIFTFLCNFTLTPGSPCCGGEVIGSDKNGRLTVGAGE